MAHLHMKKEGFVNRHTNGLPDKITTMRVITKDVDGEHIYLCEWKPSQYSKENDGYLGTAKVIEGRYTGIGFHAWEKNNSEFVWYSIVWCFAKAGLLTTKFNYKDERYF